MSDYQISFVAPCVIVGMLVFIVMALFFGWVIAPVYEHRGEKEIMKQAIEHNAAYYEGDPKTGESVFKWREFPPRTMILKPNGTVEAP